MNSVRWLPKGFVLPDGSQVLNVLESDNEWQIFDLSDGNKLLLVLPALLKKWIEKRLVDETLFASFCYEESYFSFLRIEKTFILSSLSGNESPGNKVDGLAFSLALKVSRQIDNESSFHDAIYVEQYSRLLPTWTMTPRVEDDVVLGKWITGGVEISVSSFRRLSRLTGWISSADLAQIVEAAGFDTPADAEVIWKLNPKETESTAHHAQEKHIPNEDSSRISRAKKTFSLPGRPQLEDFFNEHVIDIVFNSDRYRKLGIEFPPAIVLHGPPGCGKTYAVERLVEFLDWPSFYIDSKSVGSPFIHDTSKKISNMFEKAMEDAPSVLIIDEMESFLSERGGSGATGQYHVEEVAEFLRRIPEAGKNRVLVVAMTNMIHTIDPAVLRRGRFDHVIEVGMPSREEVTPLLHSLLEKLPVADNLSLENAIDRMSGSPLSDVAFLVREAARLAAKLGKNEIDQHCLEKALEKIPQSREKRKPQIGF